MVTKVVMPRLSLTMKEGTVGKWYKKEGEIGRAHV
jgi:pyruvate/2-oxoglutarate dehydrogenase complex dihydrolipoamide acyltransferase (E2) component